MEQTTTTEGDAQPFAPRIDLAGLETAVQRVRAEIGKIIVGQHEMLELLVAAILADGHVLIEGVPGIAKTLTAKLLARTLSIDFSRIQFTPDLMPSDILGTSIFNMKTSEFEFRRGPIFSNFILIDEINRAPAKTQSALFEVMEERQVTVDGATWPMAFPYVVVATQNPIEQEGTYRLPEAQLDRFLFKITIDYPSLDEEVAILEGHHARGGVLDLEVVEAVLTPEQIASHRRSVGAVHVEPNLLRYVAQVIDQTRNNSSLSLGASPRASLAVISAAKAFAAMAGRDFVTPDDIKRAFVPVLQHRIVPTPEREMEGVSPAQIVRSIVDRVEVPR
ncbi:MAG TPA: MoxR family ATPase [Candidatus Kapabacteria bacterium]|nr:MoxR family ATPase [Candidatus Kapabacteria bacterium]